MTVTCAGSAEHPSQAEPFVVMPGGSVKVRSTWSMGAGPLLRIAIQIVPEIVPAEPFIQALPGVRVRSVLKAMGLVLNDGLALGPEVAPIAVADGSLVDVLAG